MDILQKTISNLVETQFPSFYRDEGPVFVEFVKQYYKWLETEYCVLDKTLSGSININYSNNVIIGSNTFFETYFSNVGTYDAMGNQLTCPKIAVFRENEKDYVWYNVEFVANNTYMTVKETPIFPGKNLKHGTIHRQQNPLYHARNILEYKDIDETTEQFLLFFKEKYLKDIRFETLTNTRQLIKHALDIYRSKGTERSIDLLFRLVFGTGASVYYPGDDIFKLSDGKWNVPKYIEVSLNNNNKRFAGKQILGIDSNATAFVESVIRKNIKGKLVDILYVSNIKGVFKTYETIIVKGDNVLIKEKIKIVGSLSYLDINSSGIGSNYKIGDIVDVNSNYGENGKIRVTNVSSITGIVNYTLENGGYAYTKDADVLISEKVLRISNLQTSNTSNTYFNLFETLTQPKAYINFNSASDTFENGELIYTYYPNNDISGSGKILQANQTNDYGVLTVAVYEGDLNVATIYTESNTKSATVNVATNGYYDITTTANVMGISTNVVITVANVSGEFNRNDEIYQINLSNTEIANAKISLFSRTVGSNGIIRTTNVNGVFNPDYPIINRSVVGSADIISQDILIGVYDIQGLSDFSNNSGNYCYSLSTTGEISIIGSGSYANVGFSSDLLYEEDVELNIDYVQDYLNVDLNSLDYGFPIAGSEDIDTVIGDALTYQNFHIGKIRYLTGINQGQNYSFAPFVTTYQYLPITPQKDLILRLDGEFNFTPGELVTQSSTGARGLVKSISNTSTLYLEKLFINNSNNFIITIGEESLIYGEKSGTYANVLSVATDNDSKKLGLNAIINTEISSGVGSITSAEVINSGFGYNDGEEVILKNNYGESTAIARFGLIGKGQGYYKQIGGFLSDQKKLFDGMYYQEYSYDILSSVALNRYEKMLKKILHVAGTKYFGSLVYASTVEAYTTYASNGASIAIDVPGIIVVESNNSIINTENDRLFTRED